MLNQDNLGTQVLFNSKRSMAVDELVGIIRHSRTPTLVVEGRDDAFIYRSVVDSMADNGVNILVAGGRLNLLAIYEKLREFVDVPVAFAADREMWVFADAPADENMWEFPEVPEEYADLVLSHGYSVENDLWAGNEEYFYRRRPRPDWLGPPYWLESDDYERYRRMIDSLIRWFAFEVEEFLAGRPVRMVSLREIIAPDTVDLEPEFLERRRFRQPNPELIQVIRDDYSLKLPGRLLFSVLIRCLNDRRWGPRYNHLHLYDFLLGWRYGRRNPLMRRLREEIEQKFNMSNNPFDNVN